MGQRILKQLSGAYAVARLDPDAAIPAWADGPGFVSISRTDEELSIVCQAARVPPQVRQAGPWTCFKLQGPFAFDECGVVASVIDPLAAARIGVFVVSTFDGDHLLVQSTDLSRAQAALLVAGHRVE